MKKILLLATISVAGLLSAKNTIDNASVFKNVVDAKSTIQLCGVMVTYFNAAGEPVDQRWFTSDQPTLEACQSYQNGVIADLIAQGYRVEKSPTDISTDIN